MINYIQDSYLSRPLNILPNPGDAVLGEPLNMLLQQLGTINSLSANQTRLISCAFNLSVLKRKEYYLSLGRVNNQIAFLAQGSMRMFTVDAHGYEYVINIYAEGCWVYNPESFAHEQPSYFYIEALEDCCLLTITKHDLDLLKANIPALEQFMESNYEAELISMQNRMHNRMSMTAQERVSDFAISQPAATNRFPQTVIASYLGIKPETLSRIRKQLTKTQAPTPSNQSI